jgi:hypothetical protein
MYVYTTYTRPLSIQAQYSRKCPIISSSCYNSSPDTWTVVCLTAAKFKPLIFPVSGFALSNVANQFTSPLVLLVIYPWGGPHGKHRLLLPPIVLGVFTDQLPSNKRSIVARLRFRGNVFTESLLRNGSIRHSIYRLEVHKLRLQTYLPVSDRTWSSPTTGN